MNNKQKKQTSSKSPPELKFYSGNVDTQENMIDRGEINKNFPTSHLPSPSKFRNS